MNETTTHFFNCEQLDNYARVRAIAQITDTIELLLSNINYVTLFFFLLQLAASSFEVDSTRLSGDPAGRQAVL